MIYSGSLCIANFGSENLMERKMKGAFPFQRRIFIPSKWNLIRAGWIRNLDLSRDFFERLSGSWSSNISIVFDWIMGQLRGEA